MTLRGLLKQNEAQIKEAEGFFDESFQAFKELNPNNKIIAPKPPEINEIHIISKRFPLQLSIPETIHSFLKSGVIRTLENHKGREFFDELFKSKIIEKLTEKFVVLVFMAKFPEENSEIDYTGLRESLGKSIRRKYSNIFVRSPKPNNELLNAITFSIGYLVNMLFFQTFPLDRTAFSMRFVFDVYHVIIFHFNGLFISDYYLQTQFERVFTSRFMDYELNRGTVSQIEENEEQNKSFVIAKASFSSNTEPKFHEFAGELANRLKMKQKMIRRRDSEKSLMSSYRGDKKPQKNFPKKSEDQPDTSDGLSERMRFNCFQISPSISAIVNAPVLPRTKTKTINYSLDKSYLNKTKTFIQLYECFQRKLQHHTAKPSSKSLPKISSFHTINENFINENVKIDSLEKAGKLRKHMKDLAVRLKKQEQRFCSLHSAKQVFEFVRRRNTKNEKPSEIPKKSEPNVQLPIVKLGQVSEAFKNSTSHLNNEAPWTGLLPLRPALSKHLVKTKSQANLKTVVAEKETKRVPEKLNAIVFENGDTVDINEGLKNKVKTYFMLNPEPGIEDVIEEKEKKRDYINKYSKLVNESIDDNIKAINSRLQQLNRVKFHSFHK